MLELCFGSRLQRAQLHTIGIAGRGHIGTWQGKLEMVVASGYLHALGGGEADLLSVGGRGRLSKRQEQLSMSSHHPCISSIPAANYGEVFQALKRMSPTSHALYPPRCDTNSSSDYNFTLAILFHNLLPLYHV